MFNRFHRKFAYRLNLSSCFFFSCEYALIYFICIFNSFSGSFSIGFNDLPLKNLFSYELRAGTLFKLIIIISKRDCFLLKMPKLMHTYRYMHARTHARTNSHCPFIHMNDFQLTFKCENQMAENINGSIWSVFLLFFQIFICLRNLSVNITQCGDVVAFILFHLHFYFIFYGCTRARPRSLSK